LDTHTNNAVRLTSGKQRVDADGTKVVTDDTINATTKDADTHTNNAVKTAKTDSNALSMMNTGASDVVIEGTNNAYVSKETDAAPHINPGARYQTDVKQRQHNGCQRCW
jgi:hypothetical protein